MCSRDRIGSKAPGTLPVTIPETIFFNGDGRPVARYFYSAPEAGAGTFHHVILQSKHQLMTTSMVHVTPSMVHVTPSMVHVTNLTPGSASPTRRSA